MLITITVLNASISNSTKVLSAHVWMEFWILSLFCRPWESFETFTNFEGPFLQTFQTRRRIANLIHVSNYLNTFHTSSLIISWRSPDRSKQVSPAMRLIVPLRGVIQGRGGLFVGSLIPCCLFYFLQLYLKRRRSPPDPPPTSSRSNLFSRGNSIGRVRVSSRAVPVAKPTDSPYYIGLERVKADPYDRMSNRDGIIQLGLAESTVSFENSPCFLFSLQLLLCKLIHGDCFLRVLL